MKFTFLFLILGLFFSTTMYSQTSLSGKVVETNIHEELIGAEVRVYKEDVLIHSVQTDIDGDYKVNLDPNIYEVEVSYTGLSKYRKTEVFIEAGRNTTVDFNMKEGPGETIVEKHIIIKIEVDRTTSCGVTSEQIRNLPTRNVSAIAKATAKLNKIEIKKKELTKLIPSEKENELLSKIKYFLNSTTLILTIQLQNELSSITVINSENQEVLRLENVEAGQREVDVSNLSEGFYLIRFKKDKTVASGKLVVIRP